LWIDFVCDFGPVCTFNTFISYWWALKSTWKDIESDIDSVLQYTIYLIVLLKHMDLHTFLPWNSGVISGLHLLICLSVGPACCVGVLSNSAFGEETEEQLQRWCPHQHTDEAEWPIGGEPQGHFFKNCKLWVFQSLVLNILRLMSLYLFENLIFEIIISSLLQCTSKGHILWQRKIPGKSKVQVTCYVTLF